MADRLGRKRVAELRRWAADRAQCGATVSGNVSRWWEDVVHALDAYEAQFGVPGALLQPGEWARCPECPAWTEQSDEDGCCTSCGAALEIVPLAALQAAYEAQRPRPASEKPPEYVFHGPIYNRPCGRGVCLGVEMSALAEEIPEGWHDATIIVRSRIPAPERDDV